MLLDAFTRLLDGHCTPAFARACAANPALAQPLVAEIEASGFFDVLRPEAEGGADAGLPALAPLVIACGERLCPVPYGAIAVARWRQPGLDPQAAEAWFRAQPPHLAAAVRAAEMAGQGRALLAMTITHVTTREQFGRPIAAFQAIQQQLAQMAEEVVAATLAAHIGLGGTDFAVERSAVAKLRAGEAATRITAIAHQLHGAIGATQDFDLQLWTGALNAARLANGSESHWAAELARHRLASAPADSASYIRTHLQTGDAQ